MGGVTGGRKYYVTVRYGLCEIAYDAPLYGTPEPVGVFTTSEVVFRKIALKVRVCLCSVWVVRTVWGQT